MVALAELARSQAEWLDLARHASVPDLQDAWKRACGCDAPLQAGPACPLHVHRGNEHIFVLEGGSPTSAARIRQAAS